MNVHRPTGDVTVRCRGGIEVRRRMKYMLRTCCMLGGRDAGVRRSTGTGMESSSF
jgi:hypothetical protein